MVADLEAAMEPQWSHSQLQLVAAHRGYGHWWMVAALSGNNQWRLLIYLVVPLIPGTWSMD